MNRYADLSFSKKLFLHTMLASGVAMALAAAAVVTVNRVALEKDLVRNLTLQARIVATNSTAALAFDDPEAARQTLAGLGADPSILGARLYDGKGVAFAAYSRGGDDAVLPRQVIDAPPAFEKDSVSLVEPVILDGERIGSIYVKYDTSPFHQQMMAELGVIGLAMLACLILAYFMAIPFQRSLTRPIVALCKTAQAVSRDKDYTVRAVKRGNDELGTLTDAFNDMLTSIQARNDALRAAHGLLEQQVEERTIANAMLLDMKTKAEAADRAKSEFLANMSHEIRTPMTAILGFADLLLEEGDLDAAPPERVEAAKTIKRNGEHLLEIINDILDLSKIEAGKMMVERLPCSPVSVVAEVASLVRVRTDAKKLTFQVEHLGPIPEMIETDPTRLRQILINLIGNAIKFTERGGVRLEVRLVDESTEPLMQFDVVDTGVGMDEEQVTGLFRPFTQADTSTTRRFGGTGLGLTISKGLAETLRGDVCIAETQKGVGSRFRLTIATGSLKGVRMIRDGASATVLAAPEEKPSESAGPSDLHDCRVLLAEDGPDNQRLISHVLTKAGVRVEVRENGKLALDAALEARGEDDPFDVILMDMQMPVMDGYLATSQLRRKGYAGPIIALTAHAMEGDRQKCLDAGCNDYATKPVKPKDLIEIVGKHLHAAAIS